MFKLQGKFVGRIELVNVVGPVNLISHIFYDFLRFGDSKAYHADNEYASLKGMEDAFQILLRVISISDSQ